MLNMYVPYNCSVPLWEEKKKYKGLKWNHNDFYAEYLNNQTTNPAELNVNSLFCIYHML